MFENQWPPKFWCKHLKHKDFSSFLITTSQVASETHSEEYFLFGISIRLLIKAINGGSLHSSQYTSDYKNALPSLPQAEWLSNWSSLALRPLLTSKTSQPSLRDPDHIMKIHGEMSTHMMCAKHFNNCAYRQGWEQFADFKAPLERDGVEICR